MTLHQYEKKGESKEVNGGMQRESDEEELRDIQRRLQERR
jgi:hypothetical protein